MEVQEAEVVSTTEDKKLEPNEFEQFKQCLNDISTTKELISENFIVEQRCISNKPKLMVEYDNSIKQFDDFKKVLQKKYGEKFNVDLSTGTITYK